jgi:DNA repair exonuclease SbcCD nuclease subunit
MMMTNESISANPRIRMETAPAALWSSAAKKQNVERAAELGLVDSNHPTNRRRMRDVLNASEFEDVITPNVKLAEWENSVLKQGNELPLRQHEDPEIHLDIHIRFTLRPDYEEQPDEVKQAFERHIAATLEKVKANEELKQTYEGGDPETLAAAGTLQKEEAQEQEAFAAEQGGGENARRRSVNGGGNGAGANAGS